MGECWNTAPEHPRLDLTADRWLAPTLLHVEKLSIPLSIRCRFNEIKNCTLSTRVNPKRCAQVLRYESAVQTPRQWFPLR